MPGEAGLVEWVAEALAPLGDVTSRAMMGGRTLYCDGTIFAIIADDELWFKSDAESDPLWEEAGCQRFTYAFKDGRTGSMNYRAAPADVHDDAEAMLRWATLAVEAGRRAAARKRPKKR